MEEAANYQQTDQIAVFEDFNPLETGSFEDPNPSEIDPFEEEISPLQHVASEEHNTSVTRLTPLTNQEGDFLFDSRTLLLTYSSTDLSILLDKSAYTAEVNEKFDELDLERPVVIRLDYEDGDLLTGAYGRTHVQMKWEAHFRTERADFFDVIYKGKSLHPRWRAGGILLQDMVRLSEYAERVDNKRTDFYTPLYWSEVVDVCVGGRSRAPACKRNPSATRKVVYVQDFLEKMEKGVGVENHLKITGRIMLIKFAYEVKGKRVDITEDSFDIAKFVFPSRFEERNRFSVRGILLGYRDERVLDLVEYLRWLLPFTTRKGLYVETIEYLYAPKSGNYFLITWKGKWLAFRDETTFNYKKFRPYSVLEAFTDDDLDDCRRMMDRIHIRESKASLVGKP